MNKTKERTKYIDTLKAICTISIVVFHFLLLFFWDGFIGWGNSIPEGVSTFDYYFRYFPYSILVNNSFPLYIFYGITSFTITNSYFKNYDDNKIYNQAKKRYFRFLPIVLGSFILSYICYEFKLYNFEEFYNQTGNNWVLGRIGIDSSLKTVIFNGLIGAFFKTTQIISSLWCLQYLFLGSYLVYGLLLLCKRIKNRWIIYFVSSAIIFHIDQAYLSFIFGIIASDIYINKPFKNSISAFVCLISGIVIGLFPPVLLPSPIEAGSLYALGILLVLISLDKTCKDSKLMNNDVLSKIGVDSLSYIVANHFSLFPFSTRLYVVLVNTNLNNVFILVILFIVYLLSELIIGKLFALSFNPISNYICNKLNSN